MTDKRLINIGDGRIVEMTEMGEVPAPPPPPRRKKNAYKPRKKAEYRADFKNCQNGRANNGGKPRTHIPGYAEWFLERSRQVQAFMVEKPKSRKGVPDGMRREEAEARWIEAREQAKKDMAALKDAGVISQDDARAEEAMQATLEIMRSPMSQQQRLVAARQVLEWTKPKPASKQEVSINAAEAWLASLTDSDSA